MTMRNIANWKCIRLIGTGGMAEVFEVENERIGVHAALKLFSCQKDPCGQLRTRFLAEAALLARLNHPRLVRVHDYGIDAETDRPYFVMDLVLDPSGQPRSLADGQFAGAEEERVATWYDDIRDALAYVHAHGIVHRDIKLQNVLIGPDGHAVLSDFGVARIFDSALRKEVGLSPEATLHSIREGRRTVMGSLGYLAPELELGVAASPASDYYALGVLVFYLLTGTWCEPRTDIVSALETFSPPWREILPKLLHANPAARECPSWKECEMRQREKESAEWEDRIESLEQAVRAARRGSRIARLVAAFLGICLLALTWLLASRPPAGPRHPTFSLRPEDICFVPNPLPAELADSYDLDDFNEVIDPARESIASWIERLNRGEISCQAAIEAMKLIARHPPETVPDMHESEFKYLLNLAAGNLSASNLTSRATK